MRRLPLLLGLVLVLSCSWALPALAGSSDDQAIADGAVLTEADVADYGLRAGDPPDDTSTPSGAVCKGVRASQAAADDAPNAVSYFTDYISTNVEDHVTVFETVKEAKAAIAPYLTAKALKCAEKGLKESLRKQLPDGARATFNGERQEIPVGDGGIVLPITVDLELNGETSTSVIEIGVFRVGRAFVSMSTLNNGEVFSGSEALATTIADNLSATL